MTRRRLAPMPLVIAAAAAALAVAVAAVLLPRGGAPAARACPGMLVPAYVGPAALEEIAAAPARPRIVVVNPANGPGAAPDPAYRRAIDRARGHGTKVLGYVATGHGARDAGAVVAEAERYASWYRVDGIFLDEAAADPARLPYYRTLARGVRAAAGGLVVLNPGVVPARGYFDVADVVVTFEGPYADMRGALAGTPAWVRALGPSRVAHLAYAATPDEAARAAADPPGDAYAYVTTGAQPNPWRTIPAPVLAGRDGSPRCA